MNQTRLAPSAARVLILSHDLVGPKMAGPGVRYWELARVLAASCRVTLAAPLSGGLPGCPWRVVPLSLSRPEELTPLLAEADVLVANGFMLYDYPQLAALTIPWVVDVYIPQPTEGLALYQHHPLAEQEAAHRGNTEMMRRFFALGDFFICANERQRDLYLGVLAAVGRLNPHTYGQDPTLRQLIDVVPFGLPAEAPVHRRAVLKGVRSGVSPQDKVILWGGGIWDWLDPLTLVRALAQVAAERPDVRLYFPGTRHPFTQRVPEMAMHRRTLELCQQLGLTDRIVFFGDWIPYEDRGSYLLEADIGVSLHHEGIEARFAFRTRVLDYIWAGLPMIVSSGDSLAELVRERGLGIVVAPGDVEGVAAALRSLLAEEDARAARRERFRQAAQELRWEAVAAPLAAFCRAPRQAADRRAGYLMEDRGAEREVHRLQGELALARQRQTELEHLVAAYERGRFIRLMAALRRWRARLRGKP